MLPVDGGGKVSIRAPYLDRLVIARGGDARAKGISRGKSRDGIHFPLVPPINHLSIYRLSAWYRRPDPCRPIIARGDNKYYFRPVRVIAEQSQPIHARRVSITGVEV